MSPQKIWLRAETKPAEARSARECPALLPLMAIVLDPGDRITHSLNMQSPLPPARH